MKIESNKGKSQTEINTSQYCFVNYIGKVSSKEFDSIIKNLEIGLTNRESNIKLRKKVFNIAIEILQNIYHHADQTTVNIHSPVTFSVRYDQNEGYLISSKNLILQKKIDFLESKLNTVNSLTKDKIVHLYRDKLAVDQNFWKKGGAGLGLLDAKRRSGSNFFYSFEPISGSDVSFFEVTVKVTT